MRARKIIIAAITLVLLFCNTATVFAKTIPDHYKQFVGTWAHEKYGFEYYSLAFRLKAGEIFTVQSRLPDGTKLTFYYVCDGNHTLRLATPRGEVITQEELESWIAGETQSTGTVADSAVAVTDTDENVAAAENSSEYTVLDNELGIIQLVNEERAKAGLNPVTINTDLCKAARTKAQEMVDLDYFSHESPTYGLVDSMAKAFGVENNGSGECIAYSGGTYPSGTMWDWMHSEGHRKVILDSRFTEIGVGLAENGKGLGYWSLMMVY
jgi:uncharacterized protein YkwD